MKTVITCRKCTVQEELPAGEPKDKPVAFAYSFRLDDYRCLSCGAKGASVRTMTGKPEVRPPRQAEFCQLCCGEGMTHGKICKCRAGRRLASERRNTPIAKLERWVRKKIGEGSWQASYEEFLEQILKVKKE